MHTELFQSLGLSPNEAQIYEALLTYGGSGISALALRSGVHRSNAYDIIERLQEKGLVYETLDDGDVIFEPVHPSQLAEIVQAKEQQLAAALPEMFSLHRTQRAGERAYIYKGVEGMKNFLREALQVGEDMYEFGAKGGWFDPRLRTFIDWFLKEAKKRKMTFYHIFDHEVQHKVPHVPKAVGQPYKFAPKKYTTESAIEVFGDRVVTFTGLGFGKLEDDVTIFVIVSPHLAESYRLWWKLMWQLLPDPPVGKKRIPSIPPQRKIVCTPPSSKN